MCDQYSGRSMYIGQKKLVAKNTIYSTVIPPAITAFNANITVASIWQMSLASDMDPYFKFQAGQSYWEPNLFTRGGATFYFRCPSTTATLQLVGWGPASSF